MAEGRLGRDAAGTRLPPHVWFGVSAIFHFLGPSFAVLLFPAVGVLGVAWLRIGSAALIFAPWTRPRRTWRRADPATRRLLLGLGLCLAAMNTSFYLALDRLPMSLVASIEFVGVLALAAWGLRSRRNLLALGLAAGGVGLLVVAGWDGSGLEDAIGLFWAFLNGGLFVCYVLLGHRLSGMGPAAGIAGLGTAMALAFLFVLPLGLVQVVAAVDRPWLLLAGIGVGLCSSVIPYVCDQLAMARLPRASFALMLALLPATATVVAALVLAQVPAPRDMLGVGLVMAGVALHRPVQRPGDTGPEGGAP